jgi:hypothetical protein
MFDHRAPRVRAVMELNSLRDGPVGEYRFFPQGRIRYAH